MTFRAAALAIHGLLAVPLPAAVHGPVVQWGASPRHEASIRWIETTGGAGVEGDWAVGASGFGYGDADDVTVLRSMEGKYASLSIRRGLSIPAEIPDDSKLLLVARYDDAFILWLDGREAVRKNVRIVDGREQVIQKHEAGSWEEIPLGTVGEARGVGVVAVTGYNDGLNSSDFTLDLRLVAMTPYGPRDVIASGADWEYLAGTEPSGEWKTVTLGMDRPKTPEPVRPGFSWRVKGEASWREAPVGRHAFANTAHQVGFVDLEELPAGSDIEFRLGETTHTFRTAPEEVTGLRFVTGGDMYHQRELLDAMNRRAGAEDPSFALLGGDFAYTNDVAHDRWFAWFDSWAELARTPDGRLVPMMVAIGNHEMVGAGYRPNDAPGPGAASEFFSLFKMQETGKATQTVDFGKDLAFLLLDSGHAENVADQNGWLEEQLKAREDVPRLFVCYHRPAWGCGTKENAVELQREWCPLFERYQVDGAFENDHHVFSRTYPIVGGKRDDARGIPYLGAGAWGVVVRSVPEEARRAPYIAASDGVNHLYVVELGKDGWSAVAKAADGQVIDRSEYRWRR